MEFLSNTVDETIALGTRMATFMRAGDVVLLIGDLGAGKTHFTQGFAAGMGITETPTSPTFNIMCVYEGSDMPLYHFDLYRLNDPDELEDIDYFGITEGDGVSVVEWGDRFEEAQPDDYIMLDFHVLSTGQRQIECTGFGRRGAELMEAFSQDSELTSQAGEGPCA